jgi:drug/metabolite transporter (DMT)-like permease
VKWALLSLMVGATAASDLLQSRAMKREGDVTAGARGLTRLLKLIAQRRDLILSIALLAFSFFAFMALVQAQPLSFAVPASAGSFIVETILAKLVLKEHIGARRVAGTLLVLGGVILVARERAPRRLASSCTVGET